MEPTWQSCLKLPLKMYHYSTWARLLFCPLFTPTRQNCPPCTLRSSAAQKTKMWFLRKSLCSSTVDSVDSTRSLSSLKKQIQEPPPRNISTCASCVRTTPKRSPQFMLLSFLLPPRCSASRKSLLSLPVLTQWSQPELCWPPILCAASWSVLFWLDILYACTRRRQQLGICSSTLPTLSTSSQWSYTPKWVSEVTLSSS